MANKVVPAIPADKSPKVEAKDKMSLPPSHDLDNKTIGQPELRQLAEDFQMLRNWAGQLLMVWKQTEIAASDAAHQTRQILELRNKENTNYVELSNKLVKIESTVQELDDNLTFLTDELLGQGAENNATDTSTDGSPSAA